MLGIGKPQRKQFHDFTSTALISIAAVLMAGTWVVFGSYTMIISTGASIVRYLHIASMRPEARRAYKIKEFKRKCNETQWEMIPDDSKNSL